MARTSHSISSRAHWPYSLLPALLSILAWGEKDATVQPRGFIHPRSDAWLDEPISADKHPFCVSGLAVLLSPPAVVPWRRRSAAGSAASWETQRSCVLAGWGSRAPRCQPGCRSSSKANKVENGSWLRVAELETEPPPAPSEGSAGAAPGGE